MSSKNHSFQLKALAYVRASTSKQDINNQKLELFEYARQKRLRIDNFIKITISTRKTKKQQRIDEVMEKVKNYDEVWQLFWTDGTNFSRSSVYQ